MNTYTFTSPDGRTTVDRTEEQFAQFQAENSDWTYAIKPPKEEHIQPLAAHLQEVEDATDIFVRRTLSEHNYISIGEAAAIATVLDSIWHDEASAICEWYNAVYEKLYAYFEAAKTERMSVEQFLTLLPIFEPENQ